MSPGKAEINLLHLLWSSEETFGIFQLSVFPVIVAIVSLWIMLTQEWGKFNVQYVKGVAISEEPAEDCHWFRSALWNIVITI